MDYRIVIDNRTVPPGELPAQAHAAKRRKSLGWALTGWKLRGRESGVVCSLFERDADGWGWEEDVCGSICVVMMSSWTGVS